MLLMLFIAFTNTKASSVTCLGLHAMTHTMQYRPNIFQLYISYTFNIQRQLIIKIYIQQLLKL